MTEIEFTDGFSNANRTLGEELDERSRQVEIAEAFVSEDEQVLAGLDDTAIYEWAYCQHEKSHVVTKREIAKQTDAEIWLHPRKPKDDRQVLRRDVLERGGVVSNHRDGWESEIAFGSAFRFSLQIQLNDSVARLAFCKTQLHSVEETISNSDVLLSRSQQRLIDSIRIRRRWQEAERAANDWRIHGF